MTRTSLGGPAVVFLLVFAVLSGCTSKPGAEPASTSLDDGDRAAFPAGFELSGIDAASGRLLVHHDGIRYWSAAMTDGQMCLLIQHDGDVGGASACTPAEQFQMSGVGIGWDADDTGAAGGKALLTPDAVVPADVEDWVEVQPNLYIRD